MSILQSMATDAGTIGNSSASAVVVGASFLGMGVPDWAAIITGGYFLVSTVFLIIKYVTWRKDRKCYEKGLLPTPPRWD